MAYRPDRFPHSLVPSITVSDADAAIEFYRRVFDAEATDYRLEHEGVVMYAEVVVGGSPMMLNEEMEGGPNRSPTSIGDTPVRLHVHVPDVDAVFSRAVAAGATTLIEPSDQFYGERSGRFRDPFGHEWIVSTLIEEMTPEQMSEAMDDWMRSFGG